MICYREDAMSGRVWPAVAALLVLLVIGWWAVKLVVSLAFYLIVGLLAVGAALYLYRRARATMRRARR
jgi:glucose dehydrogenase